MNHKKPELLISTASLEEVERVFQAGADAVNIGTQPYALRMPGNFDLQEIREAVQIAQRFKGKAYVSVNALLHQNVLEGLEEYIRQLDERGVHAIVFGDPAVLVTVRHVAPRMPLHWNTETTSTNYRTVNYWAKKGASRAILSRELSLEAVLEIKRHTAIEIQTQIHGATCIFHSKRELVSNYMRYQDKDLNRENRDKDRMMFLKESKREQQRYPIFEDVHGTHIISSEDICMLQHLSPFITGNIDSLKIEGLLKKIEYNETVVSIYRKAIDHLSENPQGNLDPGWLEEIKQVQPKNRPLDTGFYFKEQIY